MQPLYPVEEERLRNKCCLEATGGRYKGRVYGVGHLDSQDDCVQSYLKHTQACSSQQVPLEDINELQQRLATTEDRMSEKNHEMSTQFQNQMQT
ncbi:hypothetical protein DEO72_LG9g1372 [Vigna unguiculata]|uniref:Uncharacterized protein n=1 Tax=Vigna unguiculata TaxID=3917 RepID=A0A4D6MXW1_VIGUN|nr:hypothetical protein DEO72_LG9g1372 [Vigna unguiculata]